MLTSEIGSRSQHACCQDNLLLSCTTFKLDPSVLGDRDLVIGGPIENHLSFLGRVEGTRNSFHYGNDHVDFILSLNAKGDGVYGHAALDDGNSYVIEYCGSDIHAIKHLDVQNMELDDGDDSLQDKNSSLGLTRITMEDVDTTTIVTYSVKVYYTPEFADATEDVQGFIEQVIAETNQGYINSKVAMRISLLCHEQATINDGNDAVTLLKLFTYMKESPEALRGTADVTTLLTNATMGNVCGRAHIDTIDSGATISVCAKQCALGYYSFGHEIGHNIGLFHNREVTYNLIYPDGHGHLIEQGSASAGLRTILAYRQENHGVRVNYYSNPNVIHPSTNTTTGVEGVSNNARILNLRRTALANVGDESRTCSDSGPGTGTSCAVPGEKRYFRRKWVGRKPSDEICQEMCQNEEQCISWTRHRRGSCFLYVQAIFRTSSENFSGPVLSEECFLVKQPCVLNNTKPQNRYIGRASILI